MFQLITVAVIKVYLETLSVKIRIIQKSVNWFAKQSVYWFLYDASFHWKVFSNRL